ncbi:MAG: major capsid protein [Propionibacteriaceae bacterium]|jgi:hypothetical protein|nr:major capsid protein [Propionibacteriaceae bacterium]
MATVNTDFRTPVELTGVARGAVEAISDELPLNQWLPNTDTETLSFTFDASDRAQDLAKFRSFDTPAPYGRDFGSVQKTGTIPPISQKMRVSEYSELVLAGRTGQLGQVIDKYATGSARDIAFRLEAARAEALRTGRIVFDENGLKATVDFGRDPSLAPTGLAGTARWSQSASDPIANALAWRLLPQAQKQPVPTQMLVTQDVMDALSVNAKIIAAYFGRTDNLTSRITFEQVRQTFAGYDLTIQVIDQAYQKVGLAASFFPAGTVMLLPAPGSTLTGGVLGSTEIGVPAEALQPSYGIGESERAGVFAGVFSKSDPEGLDVLVSAIAIPVVARPNATFATTVL